MKKFTSLFIALILSAPVTFAADIVIGSGGQSKATSSSMSQPKSLARFHGNALYNSAGDPIAGNRNGNVALAEFFDYQCIHCIAMSSVVSDIADNNPNVKVVYKVFSLGRPTSTRAALAALASQNQGKFLDFHHALLTANQPLNDDVIFSIAKSVGLNVEQLEKDMDSKAVHNKLNANSRLAQALKIPGTPAFFVGPIQSTGKPDASSYFFGEVSNASLQSAIEKASK